MACEAVWDDTGFTRRLSKAQAGAYMTDNTRFGPISGEAPIIANPGQALAYKSASEIRELDRSERHGREIRPRRLHEQFSGRGAVPLDALERLIDA